MALNDNNNNNKVFDPNYFSKTYMVNYNTNMSINVTFGSGLMKVAISKRDDSGKTEDIISAALTGLKAQLLVNAMNQMEADIETGSAEGKAYGTSVGMGDIVKAVAFTVEDGQKKFVIAKVDKEGTVSEKTVFEFAVDANYFMAWDDFDKMKFAKNYDNNVEYNMFKNMLIDFSRNVSGAAGYGTLYLNRYENNRNWNRMNQIMDKFGINVSRGGQSFQRSNNSFFNNNDGNNRSSDHKSLSEIEDFLNAPEDD